MANHATGDILDIHDAFAQIGIIDLAERLAVLFRDLVEDVLDVVALLFEIAQHLVNQCAVFDHEEMRVEDAGILGANGIRDSLLDLQELGTGGDEGGFKARDFLRKLLVRNLTEGNFLFINPMNNRLGMGYARGDSHSLKTQFRFWSGRSFAHSISGSSKPLSRQNVFNHRCLKNEWQVNGKELLGGFSEGKNRRCLTQISQL